MMEAIPRVQADAGKVDHRSKTKPDEPVDILKLQLQNMRCMEEMLTRWKKDDTEKTRTFSENGISDPPCYTECVSRADDDFQSGGWFNYQIQRRPNLFGVMPSLENRLRYPTIKEETESMHSNNSSVKKKF